MLRIHCEACGGASGPVRDLGAVCVFLAAHAGCDALESARVPLALLHEHRWLAVTQTDDPSILIRDCGCGARERIHLDPAGTLTLLPDSVVEGWSYDNVVYRCAQGVPTFDRWHT